MAMLCGHAAAIAGLDICVPTTADGQGEEISSNAVKKATSVAYGALISACTDGVLCIWSRNSGHCRRRRKIPPWVGSPSAVSTLPLSPRYVCITCCGVDTVHSSNHATMEHVESADSMVDRESQQKREWTKYVVVIVDSYSLNIVRTVFHGGLSIGPLKFMSIVPSGKYMEVSSIVLADIHGKMHSIMLEESGQDGDGGMNLHRSASHSLMSILNDGSNDRDNIVSLATHGRLLVLVYRTRCIFWLVDTGNSIGEISLLDGPLCDDNLPSQSLVTGGMFLFQDKNEQAFDDKDEPKGFVESFSVWNDRGAALVYKISGSDDTFKFELSCEVPAVCHPPKMKVSTTFCQMNTFVLRIESLSSIVDGSLFWRPRISIWSLAQQSDAHGKLDQQCKLLGEGSFPGDWLESSSPSTIHEIQGSSQNSCHKISKNADVRRDDEGNSNLVERARIVSSSMVLFEHSYSPYAIVYGFYSGEIKVVFFELSFQELISPGSPNHNEKPHASEQYFLGHIGPILCLAAHHMIGTSNGGNFSQILVSGSMDCTIRIWDLDTSDLITVMHHHIAPVRQIILSPPWTGHPWNNCFLTVGDDCCVALASFESMRVERMFPGHTNNPSSVAWDGARGYIACLCKSHVGVSDAVDVLCVWDVKTGTRERVLRGPASHSMFDHFCRGIKINSITGNVLGGITSASSLLFPITEDVSSQSQSKHIEFATSLPHTSHRELMDSTSSTITESSEGKSGIRRTQELLQINVHPVTCSCPFPGIATLKFDLQSLMFPCQSHKQYLKTFDKLENDLVADKGTGKSTSPVPNSKNLSNAQGETESIKEEHEWLKNVEGCIIRFSLSFLHMWGVNHELDTLLISEMKVNRPHNFIVSSGLQGDRGSTTLTFPGPHTTVELWRSSSEFCAIRSLTMVALAQHMVSLSLSSPGASSSLAAFYIRNFAAKCPDIKPPSLQVLVSFWQDDNEHVRLAARSLFHCAASRTIPYPLFASKISQVAMLPVLSGDAGEGKHMHIDTSKTSASSLVDPIKVIETEGISQLEESNILAWLESFEVQDWISCIGGTSQDAMASHIIMAAALAIWYPSLVKMKVAMLVVRPLINLLMAMNEKYSFSAAELLAEGMESTWKACIGPEIPQLMTYIFVQVDSASGASSNSAAAVTTKDALVGILLPSLAMADIPGFLHVIDRQIWSTSSDSLIHIVALMTLIRVVRGSPKPLAQYLDKVMDFILLTIDHANSVLRKACLPSAMAVLKEVVRAFPMVSVNDSSTRLAVGDAMGDIHSITIRVYDMQSVTKIKVLDASGPPGLPNLLGGAPETIVMTAISALSFSPDGEGLVAFSEHGLMIRWWSLGSGWWDKLSRNLVPVQCTKLIYVPPWEGFSPNSSRASIMESISRHDSQANTEEKPKVSSGATSPRLLVYNLDLSYHLEWAGQKKVVLTRHGHELGTFQL